MEVIMIDNKRGLSLGKVTMFAIGATLLPSLSDG